MKCRDIVLMVALISLVGCNSGPPLFPGRLKTLPHDYKRKGTTPLFAAIELTQGKIIAECLPQHRHQEWIRFRNRYEL